MVTNVKDESGVASKRITQIKRAHEIAYIYLNLFERDTIMLRFNYINTEY